MRALAEDLISESRAAELPGKPLEKFLKFLDEIGRR